MAPEGAEYVQSRYAHGTNILTTLEKIINKAGLAPWPKLMQNLGATRGTELMALSGQGCHHDAMTMQGVGWPSGTKRRLDPRGNFERPQNTPDTAGQERKSLVQKKPRIP